MEDQRVTVVDVDMPFLSMVAFMIKWALASIPAMLIVGGLVGGVAAVLATVLAGFLASHGLPKP